MDDTLKQRVRDHLKANEGEEPQPYRDSNGNLTVGVGINVNRKADFIAQKLQTKDAKSGELRDATAQEKAAEFDRLTRACRQLSQNSAETSWTAARNVLASLS